MGGEDFESIYPKYEGLVRATLRHYGVREADLDDLVQDAFVTIHRKLPEFEGRASLETWLHSVCWRIAVNYRRRAHVRRETELAGQGDGAPTGRDGDMLVPDRLHAAIAALSDKQRDLFTLAEIGGLSISQLAALTHTTRKTVSQVLKRARDALTRRIAALGTESSAEGPCPAVGQPSDCDGELIETDDSMDYIDDEIYICVRGRNTFVILRGRGTAARHRILSASMLKIKARYGRGLNHLCIVEGTSSPPDRATRKLNAELLTALGDSVTASVFVIEGPLEAILVPAVMNTAAFLSRSPIKYRYFRDLQTAAAWLAPLCDGETPASLVAQMEWMRRRLDERTGRPVAAAP